MSAALIDAQTGKPWTDDDELQTPAEAASEFPAELREESTVPGQLWERVAEGRISDDALSYPELNRLAVIRSELGTHSGRVNVRGPIVRAESNLGPLAYLYPDAYSGIIRAGQRVR